jgi:5-methylcytosine-specific restriction enzyme A
VKAMTVCTTHGCPNEVERGYCDECMKAKRAARPRNHYGDKWPAIRASYLKRHPMCEEPGCGEPGVEVHHIDERGPSGSNRDENLKSLCKHHHGKINLQPYQKRDTIRSRGDVAMRGPNASQPIVGTYLERMQRT